MCGALTWVPAPLAGVPKKLLGLVVLVVVFVFYFFFYGWICSGLIVVLAKFVSLSWFLNNGSFS